MHLLGQGLQIEHVSLNAIPYLLISAVVPKL